jgi:hypothetical protein
MPDRFVITHIKRLPLFERLPDPQIEWVSDAFQVMRFQPGEAVFRQGEPSQGMYMFVNGSGTLVQHGQDGIEHPIAGVSANQYLNEGALFRSTTETATLRVVEPAVVLALPRQRFLTTLANHPEIKSSLGLQASDQAVLDRSAFQGQRQDEMPLLVTRRHWWAFGRRAGFPAFVFVALIVIALTTNQEPLVMLGMCGLAIIFPGLLTLYLYLDWSNDRVIVTDQRVLRVERNLLTVSSSVNEVPMESIHEVNAETPTADPFARLFNYGTVQLGTAGDSVVLDLMPNPTNVQKIVFDAVQQFEQQDAYRQRSTIRADIDKLLGKSALSSGSGVGAPGSRQAAPHSPIATKFTNADGDTVYRKHIFVWLQHILLPSLVIFAGLALFLLCLISPSLRSLGAVGYALAFFTLLIGSLWFYWADWDWRNDIYIIGDETIQIIRKRPLWLQNEHDQILLNKVDSVVSDTRGLFQTLFNYGDVRISLIGAGKSDEKVFDGVANPREVQDEISRRQALAKQHAQSAEDQRQRQAIGDYLAAYHETTNPNASAQYAPPDQPSNPAQPPRPLPDRNRPPSVPRIRRNHPPR